MAREQPPRRAGFGQGRLLVQRLVLAEVLARRGEGPLARVSRIVPRKLQEISEPSEPAREESEP